MSKPHDKKLSSPVSPGQSQMMIYTEGNPIALLVTTTGAAQRMDHHRHKSPEAALIWCRDNRVQFVYLPAPVERN